MINFIRPDGRGKMRSKYLKLYEQIKEDIVQGIYKKGDKLPSKRTLAEENGISVITVEHALELLLEEGYIESRERSGYFAVYSEGEFFADKRQKKAVPERTNKSGKEEGISPDEHRLSASIYVKTTRKVLTRYEEELMTKSPPFGMMKLRLAIRDYLLRNRHIHVETDQIILGAGAEYLYGMIVRTLGRDKIYGVESPGYQRIAEVYETDGATVELLPLTEDGIESRALKETKANVLHITPYRSFPTGVTATAGKKREYLMWAKEKKGIIIEDDFESEFTPLRKPEDTLFSMNKGENVIYVNTFTRTIGPSVRIAYMLIPKDMTELFATKVGFYSCPVPVLEQYIVAELIENGDFERHINRVRRKNRLRKKI